MTLQNCIRSSIRNANDKEVELSGLMGKVVGYVVKCGFNYSADQFLGIFAGNVCHVLFSKIAWCVDRVPFLAPPLVPYLLAGLRHVFSSPYLSYLFYAGSRLPLECNEACLPWWI